VSVNYQQEFLDNVKDESLALIQDHFNEVYPAREIYDLDMDWDTYRSLEDMGLLKIFTARDDGILVGYLWVIVSLNIHSKGSFVAADDGLFVAKSHRRGSVAIKLIKFVEQCLKADGFKTFHMTGTEENPIDSLMKRMDYTKIETKFKKVL